MSFSVDLFIIIILVIGFIIGFFRNPIKCLIDMVLFIGFTFAFYNILVLCQDKIISLTGLSMSQIANMNIGGKVDDINSKIVSISENLNITLNGINGLFSANELYVGAGCALVHCVFFIISSILAFILAYAFGWIIYSAFRKKAKNMKKAPKVIFGAIVNLLLVFSFVSLTFSPICLLTENAEKVSVYYENQNLKNLITFLNDVDAKTNEYKNEIKEIGDKVTTINDEINSYESTIIEFDDSIDEIVTKYENLSARVDALSELSLDAEDQLVIDNAKQTFSEYETDIDNTVNDFKGVKDDYYNLKEEVNGYSFNVSDVEDFLNTLSSTVNNISTYYNVAGQYIDFYKKLLPSKFLFLSKLNFGYSNITFEDTGNEEINKMLAKITNLNDLFDAIDSNMGTLLNEDSVKLVKAGNDKINELVSQIKEAQDKLDSFDSEYSDYKENINKEINEGKSTIDEYNDKLDSIDEDITKIENKYKEE